MKVLALSGSLRAASINSALLRAAARLAPIGMDVRVFGGLGDLPLFNPDSDPAALAPVARFYAEVAATDALVLASPEYAHGVTGVIKNALDWLVSFEAFANKPVAVINTSPRSHYADAALKETLRTMAAQVIDDASVSIPLLGAQLTEDAMVADPHIADAIKKALRALQQGGLAKPPSVAGDFSIYAAGLDDVTDIATMLGELLEEIMAAIGVPAFNFDFDGTVARLADFLGRGHYFAFVARGMDGVPVGFITLYESYALYAEGSFGTIPELYVRPGFRSQALGSQLITDAVAFAKRRGWRRLEVTTPPLPQFAKTLAFYEREGFAVTGGRKLKRAW